MARQSKEAHQVTGVFHRMKRKGNGWVVEELTITPLTMTLTEIADWDHRSVTENKALAALARAAK